MSEPASHPRGAGGRVNRRPQRQSALVYRRRRLAVAAVVVLVAAVGVAIGTTLTGGGNHRRGQGAGTAAAAHGHATRPATPAVEAGLLPWALPAPLSRMVAVAGGGPNVVLAGGLLASSTTTAQVSVLNTVTGQSTPMPSLPAPAHDAAGAVIAGRAVVFGGGSAESSALVQSVPMPGTAGTPAQLGQLPRPRSDNAAATIGRTTYMVGGYDGANATPEILATDDGRTFHVIADLAVPVRYPAMAAQGRELYVFGGEAANGQGHDLSVIQRVDVARGRATVVGQLPLPLAAAAAFTLDGHIYVAGGNSTAAPATAPGAGTTQLAGWASAPSESPTNNTSVGTVWAFDPKSSRVTPAGRLQVPVANAGVTVMNGQAWLIGGESNGSVVGTVQVLRPNPAFGMAGQPGAGSPYYGYQLLIADRGNDRLLLMDPAMHVTWTYPNPQSPPDPLGFYFPDDAFFIRHGSAIISNQEENETIVEIGYPSGQIIWSYGHPRASGTAAGYLNEPDDAYLLPNGQITVADAQNCRVLVINQDKSVADQIGTNGACEHQPPSSMGSPNGDTPLWDGNLLVSEINGAWVSEYTHAAKLVWTAHLPISYPSDPQQVGGGPGSDVDRYLVADYTKPGGVIVFNRQGTVLSTYRVTTGPGALDHPSLAEQLPNGVYLINDDYNDRMVAIDPADGALVWQYGVTGKAGTAPGMLNTPDGFDLLGPGGTTPTHPQTG